MVKAAEVANEPAPKNAMFVRAQEQFTPIIRLRMALGTEIYNHTTKAQAGTAGMFRSKQCHFILSSTFHFIIETPNSTLICAQAQIDMGNKVVSVLGEE